jgi:hypothetical protein
MYFSPQEIETEALRLVVKESQSNCVKELSEFIADSLEDADPFLATTLDLFDLLDKHYTRSEIKQALQNDFCLSPSVNPVRYTTISGLSKTGRVYTFTGNMLQSLRQSYTLI